MLRACFCVCVCVARQRLRLRIQVCCAGAPRTMKRVYEKKEFEQVAAKATRAAPRDAERRFHVPIVGTLTCTYAGTAKPDQEFIVWNTQVTFEWRLRSPHVKGIISALDGT